MKSIAPVVALLLLSGCSEIGDTDYALYYQAMKQSIAVSFGGTSRVTKDQAAAIPYATIGYRVNDGSEQLLVLATDSGGEQLWTSGAHVVIVTRGGRIVRTVGLAQDVSGVTPQKGQQQLLDLADATQQRLTSIRLEDFPNIPVYGAVVKCTAIPRGPETIVILGRGITTKKVDEDCRNQALNWSFTDSYWINPESGFVWRSIQHLAPKDEKIELEALRPPA